MVLAMKGHVPHWLPEGFGLVRVVEDGGGGVSASWSDLECREVSVGFTMGTEPRPTGPIFGAWVVTVDADRACGNYALGTSRCLGYEGTASDGTVGIQAMGIDRSIGDRIARSIPL
jgi:hypothetical protein